MLGQSNGPIDLFYAILSTRAPITLDLWEAERYESAIVVQPLVGNLVYYSNKGRYEPRLAKTWQRTDSRTWEFDLHSGLVCENGEAITARSFKASIERSIRMLAASGGVPVLDKLDGYELFLKQGGDLSGIVAQGSKLIFRFNQATRSGVAQVLSFAPFGYICQENLNHDGSWRDSKRFVSSGPYRVEQVEIGSHYVLTRRSDWLLPFSDGAPGRVAIVHKVPADLEPGENWIVDRVKNPNQLPVGLELYSLVPEYFNCVQLGNLMTGFFSKIEHRRWMKSLIETQRDRILAAYWENQVRSRSMYPSQDRTQRAVVDVERPQKLPERPLIIGGREPEVGHATYWTWQVLKAALDEAKIKYRFIEGKSPWETITNQNFDFRMTSASIGGGVEAWGLSVLFASHIGSMFADPSGNIRNLLADYENDNLNDDELTKLFLKQVASDASIVPISHFGVQLYLSEKIKKDSLSPTLSILRFDKVEIE